MAGGGDFESIIAVSFLPSLYFLKFLWTQKVTPVEDIAAICFTSISVMCKSCRFPQDFTMITFLPTLKCSFCLPAKVTNSIKCDHLIKRLLSPGCGDAALLTVNKSSSREKVKLGKLWVCTSKSTWKICDVPSSLTFLLSANPTWNRFSACCMSFEFRISFSGFSCLFNYGSVKNDSCALHDCTNDIQEQHDSTEDHFKRLLVSEVQPCTSAGGSFH